MVLEREFYFPSSDGVHHCFVRQWSPAQQPKGVVLILHGVAEHIGRYSDFASFLAEQGYVVCGHDHLGHGKTGAEDSKFGYFSKHDGWTLVTADARALFLKMRDEFSKVPFILFGHSMGSFLARTFLCRYPGLANGAIISGTGMEPALTVAAGKALCTLLCKLKGPEYYSPFVHSISLGGYNKQFEPARTPSDWLSRDEAVVDRYLEDPFCGFPESVGLMRDMMGGLQYIVNRRAISQMDVRTPIFFLSGDCDPVGQNGTGVKKVYQLFKNAGCLDVSMKLYPEGRHEMLNELNKDEVYNDILRWLEAHI